MIYKIVILSFVFAACSLPTDPMTPGEEITELERRGFEEARAKIAVDYKIMPSVLAKVRPEHFRWRMETDGFMKCYDYSGKEVDAVGCFDHRFRLIRWHEYYPWHIPHEAGHAILWAVGHRMWACYEHGCN